MDSTASTITTGTKTFVAVPTRKRPLEEALRAGDLTVSGDLTAVERLLDSFPRPETAEAPSA